MVGNGLTLIYASFNKPATIARGSAQISFAHDSEHQRFKQVTPEGTTLYIAGFGVMAEVLNPGQSTQRWTDYLSVGNAMVGMRTLVTATATLTTRYFHTDHLGSVSVITDENGLVVERLFDFLGAPSGMPAEPFGKIVVIAGPRGSLGDEGLCRHLLDTAGHVGVLLLQMAHGLVGVVNAAVAIELA